MSAILDRLRRLLSHEDAEVGYVAESAIFTIERLESETKDLRLRLLDAEIREAEARKR